MWRGASGNAYNPAAVAITGGTITGITDLAVADGGTGASTGIAAAQNLGHPYILARWGVPVILASTGSMANNGAVSAMTALPVIYTSGAWLYLPAGAVAAGVPATASFLWFVGSSTTAGTVYNSTWDGLSVPGMGTTTAFVTTGPGAFTGIAAGEIVAATITVPAGAMGPNGRLRVDFQHRVNTAAGNKTPRIRFSGGGGNAYVANVLSTTDYMGGFLELGNQGVAGVQRGYNQIFTSGNLAGGNQVSAVDTTAGTTLVFTLEKATATNHVIWDGAMVTLVYGS